MKAKKISGHLEDPCQTRSQGRVKQSISRTRHPSSLRPPSPCPPFSSQIRGARENVLHSRKRDKSLRSDRASRVPFFATAHPSLLYAIDCAIKGEALAAQQSQLSSVLLPETSDRPLPDRSVPAQVARIRHRVAEAQTSRLQTSSLALSARFVLAQMRSMYVPIPFASALF
ncbi:hypothetical protein VTH06DRAFT_5469 [Thermothelomyces fergusii]